MGAVELLSNFYLCVLIMFWNKADELIKRLGLNNSEVARLVCADAGMSKCCTSKFGQPYRGKLVLTCLDELINAFCRGGLNPWLFEAVRTYSLRIEKRHANT
jgi:UDP-glucose 6-dehydrogenase